MARTNYSFEKRQKEIARKKKKEEKRLRKLQKSQASDENDPLLPKEDEQSWPTQEGTE